MDRELPTANVHGLPFKQVFTEEFLLQYLYQHVLRLPSELQGTHRLRLERERKRTAKAILDRWCREGALARVEGGYERPLNGEPIIGFVWDGEVVSCPRSEYPELLRQLREVRDARDPKEVHRRETELQIASLQQQIDDLRRKAG